MVKVKEESAMAEPKPTPSSTPTAGAYFGRKPRPTLNNSGANTQQQPQHHHHHHHHAGSFHRYQYHYHYTAGDAVDGSNGSTSPAKFCLGPGFEPQPAQQAGFGAGPSQAQSGEHVVMFHVHPGVCISLQIGDHLQMLSGPVTVPMVSTNSSPPIAMPVQVPPGHVVQQIVDESGTLRHVILSPQHPAGILSLSSQPFGAGPPNGTNQPPQGYYQQGLPPGFHPPHFHSSMPPGGHPGHGPSPTHPGHSPPPNPSYYKDERAQRQHIKLKKKLHDKQQIKGESLAAPTAARKDHINGLRRNSAKEKGMNSVGTSEDGEESSSVQDEEDAHIVTDILSSVQTPRVSELSSRSALLQWSPPLRLSEASSSDGQEVELSEQDLRYEVLLSDKSKEMKYKSIYSGPSLTCRIQDLRPGQEYSVCLQVHLDELQGAASDPIKFTTPPCEPDQPQPPKLIQRTKNSLQLRWNAVSDNGAHILAYLLECDDGKDGEFVELCKSRGKQHTLFKLQPATAYRFRLAALNDVGKSVYSDVVSYSTSDNAPQQPGAPNLKSAGVHALHLVWQRRPKDDEFELKMDNPLTSYGYLPVFNGKETEYVCGNLAQFTEYKFKLRAHNEGGHSVWSEEVSYRTLPDCPGAPSKPVVKGKIHAYSFRLKWEPPANTGGADIASYALELNSGIGYRLVYSGPDTEATCDSLTPGTTYQLRVSCTSAGGQSAPSDPCTVTTEAVCPGQCAPPRLHGKPRPTSVSLRWAAPDDFGGAPVLEYELDLLMPEAARRPVCRTRDTETLVPDLRPGCSYSFVVRALNRIGPGMWSDPLTVTSGAAPPEPPAMPTTVCKSPVHVLVEWQEPDTNGAPITEYRLEMSTTVNHVNTEHAQAQAQAQAHPQAQTQTQGQAQAQVQSQAQAQAQAQFTPVFQGLACSHDVKNLAPFTTYAFRVQACNSAGYGAYSPKAATVTPAAPPAQVAPPRSESTPTSITLFWHEPAANGAPITHYNIEIAPDKLITTTTPVTTYTVDALQPDTPYKIKIQAVNLVGNGPFSPTLRTSTLKLPPAAPRLECAGSAHNYLKLKWGEGRNQDYTQFTVEVENVRTREYQCVFKGTAFACKVNKLQELTAYRFRVCAANDAGVGPYSADYEFCTTMAPPNAVKAPKMGEVGQRGCALEWAPSRNASADPVVYIVQASRLRDQDFKQVYKGSETKCTIENLEPGAEYGARVCPVRVTSSGELCGPWSPSAVFSTVPSETGSASKSSSTSPSASTNSTPTHSHKSRSLVSTLNYHLLNLRNLNEQYYVLLIAIVVLLVGIVIAMACSVFFSNKF